jgi:hypothetical protein
MGQGHLGQLGGAINRPTRAAAWTPAALSRYRVMTAFVFTAFYVAVKTIAHDYWSVGFGLAVLGVILLTPQPHDAPPEAWRQHALRIVTACFVVVTIGSICTTLL